MGVDIAPNKTLAKLANQRAKRLQLQNGGVVYISDVHKRDSVLGNTEATEVWAPVDEGALF
ncbi:hypothetical protein J2Y74_002997 [Pseudomonas migulae]|nr:hypothetical protein [Pseudomonas migulae]